MRVTDAASKSAGSSIQLFSLVAVGLLITSGIGFRQLANAYAHGLNSIPIPPGTLNQLSLRIGKWEGRDVTLDEAIIRATDTDDHVNRSYKCSSSRHKMYVFIGYGLKLRDLAPHRPEVCFPGSGWTLEDSRVTELELKDGLRLPCQVYHFRRTGLESTRVTVLNYYLIDGRYCPDISLLRSKAWRFSGATRYSARVQITCDSSRWGDSADKAVTAFATDSAEPILALISEATNQSNNALTDKEEGQTQGEVIEK